MNDSNFPEQLGIKTESNIVYLDSEPVGILRAGCCFHQDLSEVVILGPNGQSQTALDRESVLAALIATGALVLGKPSDIKAIAELIRDPEESRNIAFLSVHVESCSELLLLVRRLHQSHVSFLGCGGIGSIVAALAAGMGVKRVLLVDGDKVERSNLNRQFLYKLGDIGRYKTRSLKRFLLDRYPHMEIETREKHITVEDLHGLMPPGSVAVITADTPLGMAFSLKRALDALEVQWVDAGYSMADGIIQESPLTQPIQQPPPKWEHFYGSIMPSSAMNNSLLAAETFRSLGRKIFGKDIATPVIST